MLGDCYIWLPMLRIALHRKSSNVNGKTFVYKFAVDSPTQNYHRLRFFPDVRGTAHGDELSYTWKLEKLAVPSSDSMEFKAIKTFVRVLNNLFFKNKISLFFRRL